MIAEAVQAAQEAAKASSSITGTFFLDGALLIAGLKVVEKGLALIQGKFKGGNGNGSGGPKPGLAESCLKQNDRLTVLETNYGNMKEDVTEIKGDVKTLLGRVPERK